VDALIDRICGIDWATAEERYAAQALVVRLGGRQANKNFLARGRRPGVAGQA
jgi:hypothetical protein